MQCPRERYQPIRFQGDEKLRNLGLCISKPKFSEWATIQSRITSYNYWPTNKNQTPAELAQAGFLYTGSNDTVQCFYCGALVENWSSDDEPWVKHVTVSENCDFVRLCKGDGFVNTIRDRISNELEIAAAAAASTMNNGDDDENSSNLMLNLPNVMKDLEEKMPSWSGHENVRSANEMGYEDQLIALAIITNNLTMFESPEELIERIEALRPTFEKAKSKQSSAEDALLLPSTNFPKPSDPQEQKLCKICMDGDVSVVFLPCAHLVCCPTCSPALLHCPFCRTEASARLRVFTT